MTDTPGRSFLPIVFAVSATGILANTLILPVIPDLARDLGVAPGSAGLVVAIASLPGVAVAPVIGLLADRYGRRAVLLPCLALFGGAGLAGAAAPGLGVLLGLRFLQGVGGAGLINLAIVLLGDHYREPVRARMIGLNAVVITLGLSLFPTLGGGLAERWGWRASFLPYGVAFVVAALVARVLPAHRSAAPPGLRAQLRGAGAHMRDGRVYAMAASGFVVFVFVFGVSVTLPIHLDAEFGASPVVRGAVLALPAAGAGVVSLLMGRLAARFATWDLVPVGYGMLAAAYWGVSAAPAVGVVLAPALIYGMGEGLTVVPLQDEATTLAPDEHRGLMVAVWVSAVRAGQFAGPALAGLAIGALGTQGTFTVGGALAAAATVGAVAVRRALRTAPRRVVAAEAATLPE